MQPYWNKFRNRLVDGVVEELWVQWTELGVGSTERSHRSFVDLEALLVGTWSYGRVDPRLFDEALSWCCRFGEVANTKRLGKLLDKIGSDTMFRIAGACDEIISGNGTCDWKLGIEPPAESRAIETLFLSEELRARSAGRQWNVVFEKWGLARGPFSVRDLASPPDLSNPRLSQLFARRLMGTGCRAEVFGLLIGGLDATTTEFSNMSVYSRRLVQDVLGDLKDAGVLDWEPGRGRTTRPGLRKNALTGFRIAMERRGSSTDPEFVREPRDWPSFFRGLHPLWEAVTQITEEEYEGFKAQSVLRDSLEAAYTLHSRARCPDVYNPRLSVDSMDDLLREGQAYLESLFEDGS